MKSQIMLLGALLLSSLMFSQIQFPHIANTNNNAERVSTFSVNDTSNEFLEVTNSTNVAGQFIPSLWAHHEADNRFVFRQFITTNSAQDNGTIPMMIFRAEIRNALNLTAPNGSGDFPWGTTSANVVNRPLFAWENGSTQLMRILANGNVGINTTVPSALFHTNGTLRFENIPTTTSNTYVLTTDVNGNVSRQLSSSFTGGSGIANSCNSTNFLTKRGATDLTCSQVFDNGTNVGINTTAPTAKFHNNGTVRFENLPTVTSNTYVVTSDVNGNLTKQLANFGNVTSNCFSANYLPKNNGSGLTCSQIYDNGTSVGIGTATNFAYNTNGLATTTTGYTTGILKLNIAGVARGNVFISTSDQSYKLNVAPIENALDKVMKLNGVTYNWDTTNFPNMNFDDTDHSGLIAQQVEEVLPHLVYTVLEDDKDTKGKKSVNYIEIIPYLIESIKRQQEEILALQEQVHANFQKQNAELINLQNTKIISVSPNPSSDVISVSVNIQEGVQDAKLVVYDLKGSVLNSLNVKERGNDITRTFQKDNFGSGTYIVTLLVGGKSIDSKKIIFN